MEVGSMFSIIIPVYKNEENIPRLLSVLTDIQNRLKEDLEVVFVVDGSPDQSYALLKKALIDLTFKAQLLLHSRNFGSFAAIRTGLIAAKGEFYGIMAADLQEPIELMLDFEEVLVSDICDVAIGVRINRKDPVLSKLSSSIFWAIYRKYVIKEMPIGGVDIFACNRAFRDQLVLLNESRSSLISLVFWLGFRRTNISYERQKRIEGKSSWTLKRKIEYMFDSIFAFSDAPINFLLHVGAIGSLLSIFMIVLTFLGYLLNLIVVPGYTTIILISLFFFMLNLFCFGIVGNYSWRAYENSKHRPSAIVAIKLEN